MIDWVAPCSLPCSSVMKRQDFITLYSSKLTVTIVWSEPLFICITVTLTPSGGTRYLLSSGCFSSTAECPVMSFVCDTNNTTMKDVEPIAYPLSLWLLLGAMIFVALLSSMLDFTNDSFNFWEGVTFMTLLTGQSVAHSLLTLHFPINSAHLEPQPSKY